MVCKKLLFLVIFCPTQSGKHAAPLMLNTVSSTVGFGYDSLFIAVFALLMSTTTFIHSTKNEVSHPIKDLIHSFLRIWSHLPKKPLMKNFIFCAVISSVLGFCVDYHWCNPIGRLVYFFNDFTGFHTF